MKTNISISLLFSLCILWMSCTSTKAVVEKPPKYNPRFDFEPPTRETPLSADVTIGLLNPSFVDDKSDFKKVPYSSFVGNMANDFEELLVAKGFGLRGPFNSRDEMVYGDKKETDIMLEVSISLEEEKGTMGFKQKTNWNQVVNGNAPNYYTLSGTFYQFGNIMIEATHPFTGEIFWKKSIPLPRREITVNGYDTYKGKPKHDVVMADVGVYNPIAEALDQYYQEAMETAWRHIAVEEMKMIKDQIIDSKND